MCVDREGGIKGGDMYVRSEGCEGCALTYKEREFRGGGLEYCFSR